MVKYLGIDWGEKRIGLATGDSETNLALPFKTVSNLPALLEVIAAEEIEELVLGVPKKMSRPNDPLSSDFLQFSSDLATQVNLPIHQIDERLSSLGGDALMGSKKDKAGRDEIAAALILQVFLDRQAS
ncbi:MAG: Holliday junction resolvase RuvX [Candidatus Parcubacteria bacterium]|jgi:putative Holliday junction resolvase|nr:MAG: Holliday junction resolvase RuvX [Candidatus Parcubacteria bacterium]